MNTIKKALAFTLVLAMLCLNFVACSSNDSIGGKYYLYENGSTNSASWYEIKNDNTWTDNDGFAGTYTLEDGKITLFADGIELMDGTLADGKLAFESAYYNLEYYLEGKAPAAAPAE